VNTVFQTYATGYIVQPGYHKQIFSVEDVITSDTEYRFYPGMCVLLPDSSDWRFKGMLSHRISCYGETCICRAIEKKDFAILLDTTYAEYRKTYVACNKSVICRFKQKIMARLAALHLKKGSFLKEYINRLIDIALEGGLDDFWWKITVHTLRIKAAVGVRITLIGDNMAILLIHLQSALYLLQLGYCLSFIIFLGELLHHKLSNKNYLTQQEKEEEISCQHSMFYRKMGKTKNRILGYCKDRNIDEYIYIYILWNYIVLICILRYEELINIVYKLQDAT
jgi:hypothetical protein